MKRKSSTRINLSERKKRLQFLIDEELKRRESGSVKIVDAQYEPFTPVATKEVRPTNRFSWGFYLLIISLLTSCLIGSLLVIDTLGKLVQ